MNRQTSQRKRKSRRMSQRCALYRVSNHSFQLSLLRLSLWSQEEREAGAPLTFGDIEIGDFVNVVEGGPARAATVEDTDAVQNCIYVR